MNTYLKRWTCWLCWGRGVVCREEGRELTTLVPPTWKIITRYVNTVVNSCKNKVIVIDQFEEYMSVFGKTGNVLQTVEVKAKKKYLNLGMFGTDMFMEP